MFGRYQSYAQINNLIRANYANGGNQQTRMARAARINLSMGSIPVAGATFFSHGYTVPAQVFKSPTPMQQKGTPSTSATSVFSFPSSRFSGAQGTIITYFPPRMPGAL